MSILYYHTTALHTHRRSWAYLSPSLCGRYFVHKRIPSTGQNLSYPLASMQYLEMDLNQVTLDQKAWEDWPIFSSYKTDQFHYWCWTFIYKQMLWKKKGLEHDCCKMKSAKKILCFTQQALQALLVPPLPASSNQHAFQNVKLIMLAWMNECPSSFCLIWHRITLHSKNCITCLGFEALAKFDNCKPFWQTPWSIHSFQVADLSMTNILIYFPTLPSLQTQLLWVLQTSEAH